MYATYNKRPTGKSFRCTRHEQISLFGCNNGFIPWLLSHSLSKSQGEPFAWHLDVPAALGSPKAEYPAANSIVIEIKPGALDRRYLCELTDVWGFSAAGWTPMMWRMTQLRWEEKVDPLKFVAKPNGPEIFSFIHAAGSIHKGKLVGTWIAPKASPTNSALLWPETLQFFRGEMTKDRSRPNQPRA